MSTKKKKPARVDSVVWIRLGEELKAELGDAAIANHTTLSDLGRRFVVEGLARMKKERAQ